MPSFACSKSPSTFQEKSTPEYGIDLTILWRKCNRWQLAYAETEGTTVRTSTTPSTSIIAVFSFRGTVISFGFGKELYKMSVTTLEVYRE